MHTSTREMLVVIMKYKNHKHHTIFKPMLTFISYCSGPIIFVENNLR